MNDGTLKSFLNGARPFVAGYINEYSAVQHIVPALAPHLFPDHYNRRSSPRWDIT